MIYKDESCKGRFLSSGAMMCSLVARDNFLYMQGIGVSTVVP